MIGAALSYIIGRRNKALRDYFAIFVVATAFVGMLALAFFACNENPPAFEWRAFMGLGLHFTLDGFRTVYGLVAAFMWLMTTLFSREYFAHYYRNRNRYYFFLLLTFGATLGVFFSADLVTTFLFFEMASLASYVLVIHTEKKATIQAARTYMAVVVFGGMSLLFGIFLLSHTLQTTEIGALHAAFQNFDGNRNLVYLAGAFMLVGFGAKAGMFPLHIWLPSAHPAAPAPASALLSGILTKVGVFGMIILGSSLFFHHRGWGLLLLNIGVVGMLAGAVLALFSTDLKRTIAYSSISQIGFITLGIGMQNIMLNPYYSSLAIQGTLLHMVNHSLIKLLLFLAAGVVIMNLHEMDLNKVRGFGRGKPLFTFCFLMGVLAIIGLPFWSGYVSKTLLHDSLLYYIWSFQTYSLAVTYFQVIEALFTLAGGLTTAYMIKLFVCICIEKNQYQQEEFDGLNRRYMNKLSAAVLLACAAILPILGIAPYAFMIPIGEFGGVFMQGFAPTYELDFLGLLPLRGALTSILIGLILYFLVVRVCLMGTDREGRSVYVDLWPSVLNLEERVYRPLLGEILPFVGTLFARALSSVVPVITKGFYSAFTSFRNFWTIDEHAEPANLAKNREIAKTASLASKSKQAEPANYAQIPGHSTWVQNIRHNTEFLRMILSSLAYSLLIFFIGFVIIQIILFS